MRYPDTISEYDTLRLAQIGTSLARFGDGEFNICLGSNSISQVYDHVLQKELLDILNGYNADTLLPCIPALNEPTPRAEFWSRFKQSVGVKVHLHAPRYGSSFISRPDNAPRIDRPLYWEMVRELWRGRDVIYVGGAALLANVMAKDAANIQIVACPKTNAYADIDRIEAECANRNRGRRVIIALGAAGTALAARLARRGIHALDLGHIGMFMTPENQGAFAFNEDDLTSPGYRASIRHAHETTNWGRGGASWAEPIAAYAAKLGTTDVLDYGAGGRTLAPALAAKGISCKEYDPGVPAIAIPPKIADLVVSTDVFEHIEPELIDNVMRHVYLLSRKAGYFVIAKQPAKKILDDGRNAHLSCHPTEWWVEKLKAAGWTSIKVVTDEWKKCVIRCEK